MSHIQISQIIQNFNYRKEIDAQEQSELTESVTGQTKQELLKEAKASLKEAKDTQNQSPSPQTRNPKTKPSNKKKASIRAKESNKAAA